MQDTLYLKLLENWANDNAPVFVVGPERSGTSLLFQQVSNHSAFCDFSEATVETFCFNKPWLLLEDSCPENYEMRLYVGQKNWDAFQNKIQPIVEANRLADARGLPTGFLYQEDRPKIWDARQYGPLLRTFFYFAWQNLGKKCLVEKTPAHIRSLPEIYNVFPNAKVLVCTREPSEIIASHRKRFEKEISLGVDRESPQIQWLNKPLEDYLAYFREIDDIVRHHIVQGRKILVVPYSELTEHALDTMQSIFEFIGVESNVNLDTQPSEAEARPEQLWDPLLNKPPQPNKIDISAYLNEEEVMRVKKLKEYLHDTWC